MSPILTAQYPQPFGGVHLSLLGLTVVGSIAAVWYVRRIRGTKAESTVLRTAGWVLLALAIFQTVWLLLPENWSIGRSLPLHYSDALQFITPIALIWQFRWAMAVSYYWGLTLNPQAIVTPHPSMLAGPSVDFVLYWVLHIAILVAPLVLVWGVGFRPQWKDFGTTYALAIGWAAMAMGFNTVLGTNYAFLIRPPDGDSLVDWMGPWPIYVVVMVVLAAIIWALMTLPWTATQHKKTPHKAAETP